MTTEFVLGDKHFDAIKAVCKTRGDLYRVTVGTPEYFAAVEVFEAAALDLIRLHRNWNETTGEPDGMYDYFEDEAPEGAKAPLVARDDLSTFEELAEEILYGTRMAELKKPMLLGLSAFERMGDHVADLSTYHPDFNERNGEIDS
jgi:hypothetical protein